MKVFEFSIIASGLDPADDNFENHFYGNGCDDATVSFQKGHIIFDFAREAESIDEAISSAIENVTAAGAQVERVEPDTLVSLADIAARVGVTRAAISNYANGQREDGSFPSPVARVTSDSPLWDWAIVAQWLFQRRKIDKESVVEAEAVRLANHAIECGDCASPQKLRDKISACHAIA